MDALVRPFSTRNHSDEGVQVTFFNRLLGDPQTRVPDPNRVRQLVPLALLHEAIPKSPPTKTRRCLERQRRAIGGGMCLKRLRFDYLRASVNRRATSVQLTTFQKAPM